MDRGEKRKYSAEREAATTEDDPPMRDRATHVKLRIDQILWEMARPGTTLGSAERAAIDAFDAIWPLCDRGEGEQSMTTNETRPCECGRITGVPCEGRAEVTIEWMPPWLRSSHGAAGNCGSYPHNGAQRLRVSRECAELLADEWTEIV